MKETYAGSVCFMDGWHYSVDADDQPDQRLVLEDDGTYRYATEADTESWHDRKHGQFAVVSFDDAADAVKVTQAELDAIQKLLAEMRK